MRTRTPAPATGYSDRKLHGAHGAPYLPVRRQFVERDDYARQVALQAAGHSRLAQRQWRSTTPAPTTTRRVPHAHQNASPATGYSYRKLHGAHGAPYLPVCRQSIRPSAPPTRRAP